MHENYCNYPADPCCCGENHRLMAEDALKSLPIVQKHNRKIEIENKRLKEKIDLALFELAKVENNETPTELRVVKTLKGIK